MNPVDALLVACDRFGIVAPLERAHFLAQCDHESAGFSQLVENLNYSAQALQRCWPARFTAKTAFEYAHRPVQIANKVYANRLGNGDEAHGDGWKYRGRGYLQITGKDNYVQTSLGLFGDRRLVIEPHLLEDIPNAAASAALFWSARHLSLHALKDDLVGVTRGVNGGIIGLEDRRRLLGKYKAQLGVAA